MAHHIRLVSVIHVESEAVFPSDHYPVLEAVFGPPRTPDTVPGLVLSVARMLHDLVRAHPRWWLNAPVFRKVISARKVVRQAWDVVGLERSLEVIPLRAHRVFVGHRNQTIVASFASHLPCASKPLMCAAV